MRKRPENSVCTIIGYTADILWEDGDRSVSYVTPEDRYALIGDDNIAAATWTPYFRAYADGRIDGWLIEGQIPGPCLVTGFNVMRGFLEQGCKVTSLRTG